MRDNPRTRSLTMDISDSSDRRLARPAVFWVPLLPLVALFYLGATVYSAVAHWRGVGGMWKGRTQTKNVQT